MRHASVFVSTLPLALAACVDVQSPTTPRSVTPNQPVSAAVPAALGDPSKIIYTNFGPRLTFDSLSAHTWTLTYTGPDPGTQIVSQQFTPTRDYILSAVRVALTSVSGPGMVWVLLHVDSQGLPGRVIDLMPIEALAPGPAVYVATSTNFPALEAGTRYWVTVLPVADGAVVGWNWNVIGDLSSTTFASFQGQSWSIVPNQTRGAFQIEGRQRQAQGPVVHEVSGGGTMPFEFDGDVEKLTYTVTARQMADGSTKGEMLFRAHDLRIRLKGTVTCLSVIENRAYLLGDITQSTLPFDVPHFALALEDNGEGHNAAQPDRISVPRLFYDDGPFLGVGAFALAPPPSCMAFPAQYLDWTNGNVQVR